MNNLFLLPVLLLAAINLFLIMAVADKASEQNRGRGRWAFAALIFSPLLALSALYHLSDKTDGKSFTKLISASAVLIVIAVAFRLLLTI